MVDFEEIIEKAEKTAEETEPADLTLLERTPGEDMPLAELYLGDNLRIMKKLLEGEEYRGKVSLIYIDPPFFSDSAYDAVALLGKERLRYRVYDDRWEDGIREYLVRLASRLILMRDLLSDDGLIWLHLDWHAAHYAKVLMDGIFGEDNFVNEIIWTYKSGGSTKKHFARKHDTILVYSKTARHKFHILKEKSYNRELKPYHFKGVEEFSDDIGWYTMVNMKDVWDIDMVGRTSSERTGYATQKPEALMERIIASSTDEGDLCCDFFSGSGSFAGKAAEMGRRVLASDISQAAVSGTSERVSPYSGVSIYSDRKNGEKAGERLNAVFEARVDDSSVTVTLKGISEKGLAGYLERKSCETAKSVLKDSPLDLIRNWSAGISYGGVHVPERTASRKGGDELPSEITLELPAREKDGLPPVSVKITDIFGNFSYKTINIR